MYINSSDSHLRIISLGNLYDVTISKSNQLINNRLLVKKSGARRQLRPWVAPPIGWLKANIDGAFCLSSRTGGVGVIFRDSDGRIVGGVCQYVTHVTSPDMVEALAGRFACELAVEFNLSPVIFESDCQKVVTASKEVEFDGSPFGVITEDVKFLLASLQSSSFAYVIREANMVAHKVAKVALQSGLSIRWSGTMPAEYQSFLAPICTL